MGAIKKQRTEAGPILVGLGTASAFSVLSIAILSSVIIKGQLKQESAGKLMYAIWLLAPLLGGWISGKRAGHGYFALIQAGAYAAILLLSTLTFFEGPLVNWVSATLLAIGGGGIAMLLSQGKSRKYPYVGKRYR